MVLKDNREELNLTLKFRVDDFDYTVFVSTDMMKCFGCGKTGHLVRACPDNNGTNKQDVLEENSVKVVNEGTENVHEPTQAEPGTSSNISGLTDIMPLSQAEKVNNGETGLVTRFIVLDEPKLNKSVESMDITHVTASDTIVPSGSVSLSDDLMRDLDQAVFKAPLKRKNNDKASESKQAKTTEHVKEVDADDVGNDSDFSDSSASSCSQNEWICQEQCWG